MALTAVLFDFDGTLVDTRSTSWPLFARTSHAFGLGIDTPEQFFALFSTNFYDALVRHCGDAARGAAAAAHFMDLVRRYYDPPFVPGVAELLHALAERVTFAVISSNTRVTLERLLARAGLDSCFSDVIAGDVEPSKTRAIACFLAGGATHAPADVVLVTDTTGDVREALAAGIDAYGVAWGMHDPAQLRAAGALGVADHPDGLRDWIEQQLDNTERGHRCRMVP
ncbi:MAG: HAD family hydrolase [Gammaproteobacteria bacterium]